MAERLFGLETEYALTVLGRGGGAIDRGPGLDRLMQLARRRHPNLPDNTGRGFFLASGARLYIDVPDHPEFSTPEVADPWDVVRYAQAGDRILADLLPEVSAGLFDAGAVLLTRCNVDYGGTGSTWGCHESYMHGSNPRALPRQIIPHLVSRLIFTGAGAFDSLLPGGAEFTLSPRVPHLMHTVSEQSTQSRGIFHTKDEPMARGGHHRLHILCGESLCSETAAWLKMATTALVVALIDGGLCPGDGVWLASPLQAMRRYAADPTCRARARAKTGGELTALDIQRHYLELAEAHLSAAFMPPWAEEACRRWRDVLERLENAPDSVGTVLDWAIKLALFRSRAVRHGVDWSALDQWNRAARTIAKAGGGRSNVPSEVVADQESRPEGPPVDDLAALTPQLERQGVDPRDFERVPRLRRELCEIDIRFAQLGERGLFAALDAAGVLAHRVPGIDDIERAIANPPAIGRGRVRGDWVRQLSAARAECTCDWNGLFDATGNRRLDLSDPFATDAAWQPWQPRFRIRSALSLGSF
jgi:hypothetical protein